MFEEYLEDAHYFAQSGQKAGDAGDEREARRDYRVAVFCLGSAMESFVNFIGDVFATGGALEPYEIAFLTDKRFGIDAGQFIILEQNEFHRLEDKLRFLINRFVRGFDFNSASWSKLLAFKKFRDDIVHPRQDEDQRQVEEYKKMVSEGFLSTTEVMNSLSKGIFKKPLRRKILELGS